MACAAIIIITITINCILTVIIIRIRTDRFIKQEK